MSVEDIKVGSNIRNGFGIYEVLYIEENEYCDGGYGIATVDGYYFPINECILIDNRKQND